MSFENEKIKFVLPWQHWNNKCYKIHFLSKKGVCLWEALVCKRFELETWDWFHSTRNWIFFFLRSFQKSNIHFLVVATPTTVKTMNCNFCKKTLIYKLYPSHFCDRKVKSHIIKQVKVFFGTLACRDQRKKVSKIFCIALFEKKIF